MCGRASLSKTEKELEKRFGAKFYSDSIAKYTPLPNYNIAPNHVMPVITNISPNHFVPKEWGLDSYWSKTKEQKTKIINTRIETIQSKWFFYEIFTKQRCIIPLDGYYEWKKESTNKVPYRIQLKNRQLFAVAGLWFEYLNPTLQLTVSAYSIITVPANQHLSPIHTRMPAILDIQDEQIWLNNDLDTKDLLPIIKTQSSENTYYYQVSQRVNDVRNNDSNLLKPENNIPPKQMYQLF